jgi:hypothetical protein
LGLGVSKSQCSFGVSWKYQRILPVSASSAMVLAV